DDGVKADDRRDEGEADRPVGPEAQDAWKLLLVAELLELPFVGDAARHGLSSPPVGCSDRQSGFLPGESGMRQAPNSRGDLAQSDRQRGCSVGTNVCCMDR